MFNLFQFSTSVQKDNQEGDEWSNEDGEGRWSVVLFINSTDQDELMSIKRDIEQANFFADCQLRNTPDSIGKELFGYKFISNEIGDEQKENFFGIKWWVIKWLCSRGWEPFEVKQTTYYFRKGNYPHSVKPGKYDVDLTS